MIHRFAISKMLINIADIYDQEALVPGGMAEAALGDASDQHHLAAFLELAGEVGAGAGILALAAAGGSFAAPAADAPADALLPLAPVNAMMYAAEVHYSFTPRSRSTSPRVRSCCKPRMVAFTKLMGFDEPCTLVRMLRMPQACNTSRTPGPAFTPVPGPAGTKITLLAPYWPITRCGMLSPRSDTFFESRSDSWPSFSAFS